ncbi:hypothetical protein GGQ67_003185 [Rhizobium metallidurans]|uniref:Uncharacterized protein n=1 Tax=Rhizobium metallidurans TaxID=1265931 RepID=A0A7W6CV64_9HYPH|nr:hypothetical protein [Rhizobium metallidurans]
MLNKPEPHEDVWLLEATFSCRLLRGYITTISALAGTRS